MTNEQYQRILAEIHKLVNKILASASVNDFQNAKINSWLLYELICVKALNEYEKEE